MYAVTASDARARFFPIVEDILEFQNRYKVTSRRGTIVMLSEFEFESLIETIEVLRDPYMAAKLAESVKRAREGDFARVFTLEEFENTDFDAADEKTTE
jgi:antitoxin YefM